MVSGDFSPLSWARHDGGLYDFWLEHRAIDMYSHSQGPSPAWLCLGAELEPSKPLVSCFYQRGPPPKCPEPSKFLLSIGGKRPEHEPVGVFPVPTKASGSLFAVNYQLRPSRERGVTGLFTTIFSCLCYLAGPGLSFNLV